MKASKNYRISGFLLSFILAPFFGLLFSDIRPPFTQMSWYGDWAFWSFVTAIPFFLSTFGVKRESIYPFNWLFVLAIAFALSLAHRQVSTYSEPVLPFMFAVILIGPVILGLWIWHVVACLAHLEDNENSPNS